MDKTKRIVSFDYELRVRQVEALERIATSLEKIATAVRTSRDGTPALQTWDTYQEWRNNRD